MSKKIDVDELFTRILEAVPVSEIENPEQEDDIRIQKAMRDTAATVSAKAIEIYNEMLDE